MGEAFLEQALDDAGLVVFKDISKRLTDPGADIVAYDPVHDYVYILDNKAQRQSISGAEALTGPQAAANVKKAIGLLRQSRGTIHTEAAIRAAAARRVRLAVSNAYAHESARFTRGVFDKKLWVFDVRTGRMYGSYREWLTDFMKMVPVLGWRIVGKKVPFAVIGGAILFAVKVGGVVQVYREGGVDGLKDLAIDAAAVSAASSVLAGLPVGPLLVASYALSMESDDPRAVRRNRNIETLVGRLTPAGPLTQAQSDRIWDVAEYLVDHPTDLDPPQPSFGEDAWEFIKRAIDAL
ncbi:hypothetical protein [Leifsonia aquatica]